MKVLFINSVVDFGSTGKIVRDLANGLIAQGNEVKIAYGRKEPKNIENSIDLRDSKSTLMHVAMTRLFGRHGLHSKSMTRKLIQEIEMFDPDIVHLHNVHGYYLHVPMLMNALKDSRAKVVLTLHDCWTFTDSGAYFDYHGMAGWNRGIVDCNSTKDYPEVLFFGGKKRNASWKKEAFKAQSNLTIVTPSQWLKDLVAASHLKDYNTYCIYNGIDLSVFNPQASVPERINTSKKTILGVSNIWEPRKGLDIIIEAYKDFPSDWQLVLIGLSEAQLKSLPDGVIGLQRTASQQELAAYYSSADVFINPTLEDNFPTTNLEALACGTPVVTFETGGSPEAIDATTGIVTQAKDSSALIEGILGVLNSDTIDTTSCTRRANDQFDKQKMINQYLDLYRTL